MNAEHLLDVIGQLDDDLIQEAEAYRRPNPKGNYSTWLSWAASFAVVLVLGYGVTHMGMSGGGSAGTPAGSTPAASAPDSTYGGDLTDEGNCAPSESDTPGTPPPSGDPLPPGEGAEEAPDAAVEIFGMEPGQTPAIMVDGTVYWLHSSHTVQNPEGLEVRYSTSCIDGIPEEEGQINFPKENVRYVVLEEGRVGVNWNESYEWYDFMSDPPEEP